jgi:2'-5' RNA ligase
MPQTTRTFVAIEVPSAQTMNLIQLQGDLAPMISGFRWVRSNPFHATLAFLGDVKDRDLVEVRQAVERGVAAAGCEALDLELRGVGAFPKPAKGRVIWAGLAGTHIRRLVDLQKSIAHTLTQVGYRPDEKQFHPHITLGRLKSNHSRGSNVSDAIDRFRDWTGGSFLLAEVTTFASKLSPLGPEYTPLARAKLQSQKNGGSPS